MEKGEGEEGERCGAAKGGERGEAREEEKLAGKGKKREEGGEKKRREREWCACLRAKSWASRAQAWPRLTLERSRSEVIIEHEPPSGSQPPLGVANAGIKLPH